LERLRARGGDANDVDSLLLQHIAGCVEEMPVVVDDQQAERNALRLDVHPSSIARSSARSIEASTKIGLPLAGGENGGCPRRHEGAGVRSFSWIFKKRSSRRVHTMASTTCPPVRSGRDTNARRVAESIIVVVLAALAVVAWSRSTN